MFQMFYIDVAYVCNGFQVFLDVLQVFQTHVLSVSSVFRRMLQVSHLYVLKVFRDVACCKSVDGRRTAACCRVFFHAPRALPSPLLSLPSLSYSSLHPHRWWLNEQMKVVTPSWPTAA
jgi:hypothetical protein